MKRMFKAAAAFVVSAVLIMLSGCGVQSSTTVTYDVAETGDRVALQLIAGYTQDGKNPFTISSSGKELITGSFLTTEQYEEYVSLIEGGGSKDEVIQRIEQGIKDSNIFCYFSSEKSGSTEYDFIVKIADTNTAVLLRGAGSQEAVRECFSSISFVPEK